MNRVTYIDALKGVAILCITLLHFEAGIFSGKVNIWIGSFMVYAFFFSTGWLNGVRNIFAAPPGELFRKRLRQLGMPYLWFSLLIIIFDMLWCLFGFMSWQILLRDIYKTLTLRGIGTLWFLPALLFGEFVCTWLLQRKKNILRLVLSLAVSWLLISVYEKYLPLRETRLLYKVLESPARAMIAVLNAWPKIMIGYFSGKFFSSLLQQKKRGLVLFAGLIALLLGFLLSGVSLFPVGHIERMIYPLFTIAGIICIFQCFQKNMFSLFFQYWGRNSLLLMVLHYSIFMEICQVIVLRMLNFSEFSGWITLVSFAVTVLLIWMTVPLFQGKLRFMLGKKY